MWRIGKRGIGIAGTAEPPASADFAAATAATFTAATDAATTTFTATAAATATATADKRGTNFLPG